jgi:hypothetical protein
MDSKQNGTLQNGGGNSPLSCHACGEHAVSSVHTIHPHPLRGPAYESVLLNCGHCGAKRLAARLVENGTAEAAL